MLNSNVNIMKKHQTIIRIMMAAVVMFGVQTTANAQFGKLLKKAKESLNVQIGSGDSDESSTSSTSFSGSHPKKLKDLDPEIFIYQPADAPENALFYSPFNEKVQQWYRKVNETTLFASTLEGLTVWNLTEFEDWQSPKGVRQIPVLEYAISSLYSYFMLHPNEVDGYRCLVRAELEMTKGRTCLFPYEKRGGNWYEVYPKSNSELRRVTMNDGREIYMQETNQARTERWGRLHTKIINMVPNLVSYETIKKSMQATIAEMKAAEKAGLIVDAFFLLRELTEMEGEIQADCYYENRKADADEFQDVIDDFKTYSSKFAGWRLQALTEISGTAEMPKEAAVSADIKSQATQQAKAKFGAKFVKAIVVESDWHVYTDPNNFNRTDHRSIDVDVITKDGDQYYVSHQMLWQNYQAGSWGSYDMRQKSFGQQKVNYK